MMSDDLCVSSEELLKMGVKMAKTEQRVNDFLCGLKTPSGHSLQFDRQLPIGGCPFVKKGKHKVDFHLQDPELYIEVKGWMSYASVNELEWLLKYTGKPFYLLQVTNEDWLDAYDRSKHKSIAKKIAENERIQYDEIKRFVIGEVDANEMAKRSAERIEAFKQLRAGDIERWLASVP